MADNPTQRADCVLRFPRKRPCIVNGKRHMCWSPGDGTVGVRRYHWWSPLDWVRDGWDWWRVMLKAWNAWREGREVKILAWKRGGANPERFPIPV